MPNHPKTIINAIETLFFNLSINKLYEYVRIEPRTRYDRECVQVQGFADDSILIITATTAKRLRQLIDDALRKTNDYVTSVGFKINPKKSEIMMVANDKKKLNTFEDVLNTTMGDIKIKQTINVLGLRINTKMGFLPQFNHLMSKVANLRKDTIELIGMGTNKQILSNAFAKSNGIYLYGIGIQKRWKQSQYRRAQREVNDLIRMVYNIKWKRESSWSQRDLLRLAGWPPVRIQHEMMALLFLNKIALSPNLGYLYDVLNHHLRFENGSKVLDMDYRNREKQYLEDPLADDWSPRMTINNEDKGKLGNDAKKVFPLHAMDWFNDLPKFIKYRIGSKSFETAIYGWFHVSCWCRAVKECSRCKARNVERILENYNLEDLLNEIAREEMTTIEEWTRRTDDEVESLFLSMNNEDEDVYTFDERDIEQI